MVPSGMASTADVSVTERLPFPTATVNGLAELCRTPLLAAGTVPVNTSLVTLPVGVVVLVGLVLDPLQPATVPAIKKTNRARSESGIAILLTGANSRTHL